MKTFERSYLLCLKLWLYSRLFFGSMAPQYFSILYFSHFLILPIFFHLSQNCASSWKLSNFWISFVSNCGWIQDYCLVPWHHKNSLLLFPILLLNILMNYNGHLHPPDTSFGLYRSFKVPYSYMAHKSSTLSLLDIIAPLWPALYLFFCWLIPLASNSWFIFQEKTWYDYLYVLAM